MMRVPLLKYVDQIRTSFWFVPSVMTAGAMVLALATVDLDAWLGPEWVEEHSLGFTGGPDAAGAVLGAIAGSMITIAGVVFSLTLVALAQASSQFGPRVQRNFMRDTVTQATLGTFVATFLFCLLSLRSVRRDPDSFVPHLSVTLGVVLSVASIGVLIYFIHHVSISLQADELIERISLDLTESIERSFPKSAGEPLPGQELSEDIRFTQPATRESRSLTANCDGYLQLIDEEKLITFAMEEDLLIWLEVGVGQYVSHGSTLARVWPAERFAPELGKQLLALFTIGNQRTTVQDVTHGANQLVEIAARALSPGINDPFTAMACLDRLGSALGRIAERRIPPSYRRDAEDNIRLVTRPATFVDIANTVLDQMRQHARSNVTVAIRVLESIGAAAPFLTRSEDRAALLRQAELLAQSARQAVPKEEHVALDDCSRRVERVLRAS